MVSERLSYAVFSRSPHGERGLKCSCLEPSDCEPSSLPARGAWIEIAIVHVALQVVYRRSPHGERGLKSLFSLSAYFCRSSLPARGAWIEISFAFPDAMSWSVAPRTGSVD